MDSLTLQILLAFAVDLVLGDPYWMPHPVRVIGRCTEWGEKICRGLVNQAPTVEKMAGIALTVTVVAGTYLVVAWILSCSERFGHIWYIMLSVVFLYFSLSLKCLGDEAKKVLAALEAKEIDLARKHLSGIVGRDTHDLGEGQIIRATVETVAENTVDGIISPLFYAFIGGPAMAMAYKAVNTLDSMIGYKNDRYLHFGWAAARLDDLANYIPARFASRLIPLASLLSGLRYKECYFYTIRDGRKHPSPNSGIPEAAFAGALGVQLGGSSTYGGILSEKPLLGELVEPMSTQKITEAVRLAYITSFLSLALGVGVRIVVET
jgi:adenosylcobinamide-phosphate synthase